MSNLNTNCEGCIFVKATRGVQTGCSLERDVKLGVQDSTDDNFTLKRFCNTYRPEEWLDSLSLEEKMKAEQVALDEVRPRIGFFVRLNTESPTAISDLEKTLQSIKDIEGGPAYVVVITDKVEYNEETWGLFLTIFGEVSTVKYHIVQVSENPDKIMELIDEAFTHAQNGWIMTVSSDNTVDSGILSKLHKLINEDMRQVIMIEPYNDFEGLVFPAYLFKFLNGNKNKIFQDEIVDGNDFVTKIREAEERGGTKTIMTWEEFNAS